MAWLRNRQTTSQPLDSRERYWLEMASRQITAAIPDETDAHKMYQEMAITLRNAGLSTDEQLVRGISHQEEEHRLILESMLRRVHEKLRI